MKMLIFIICCIGQMQDLFIETVSSDLDNRQGWYVALRAETPSYSGPSIIHNNELYHYFRTEYRYSRLEFIKWVKTNLIHKSLSLRMTDEDFLKYQFRPVIINDNVENVAEYGLDYFIEFYFQGPYLKTGLSDETKNAIVYQLFQWNIPVMNDGETGLIILPRQFFPNLYKKEAEDF